MIWAGLLFDAPNRRGDVRGRERHGLKVLRFGISDVRNPKILHVLFVRMGRTQQVVADIVVSVAVVVRIEESRFVEEILARETGQILSLIHI